ncbi:helix-turn-helix domain-containing protein [Actinomyces culturomici]|uniref:helix-turn-helix domain-containing protein n=1 Tax=Actinomyces culturomici TaxID=1926276 RepID=UPI001C550FA7|nr:helix-turn-helix domain-containing protein [Actinomyces culturomici]
MPKSIHPRSARLMTSIGPSIRSWRVALGLSATQVADRAGISRPTLRIIETEPQRASFGNVMAVLTVLGLDGAVAEAIDPMESARGRALILDRMNRGKRA